MYTKMDDLGFDLEHDQLLATIRHLESQIEELSRYWICMVAEGDTWFLDRANEIAEQYWDEGF